MINPLFRQRSNNIFYINAFCVLFIDIFHNFGFFFVDKHFMIFNFITIQKKTTGKVSFQSCFSHTAFQFLTEFGGIISAHAFEEAFHYNSFGSVGNIFRR